MNQFIDLPLDETLRHYQQNVKKEIYESWGNNRSIMLQMPTGTGKTRVFCSIVKDIHNVAASQRKAIKVLILVHRRELIDQSSEMLGLKYNIAHGIIMSRFYEQPKMPVQLASIQTLSRRLNNWRDKCFDYIIIDEAHHSLAPTYQEIFETFKSAKILGVTATPYNLRGNSFCLLFDKLITSQSVNEFINQGFLSQYKYYSIPESSELNIRISDIKEFDIDGDYSERALFNILDSHRVRADIMNAYLQYANGKKGIVYTINKKHNIQIAGLYKSHGVIAEAIDSNTDPKKRSEIIEKFKDGKIDVICNVNIFSEGFDCPDIEFIQLARPTKSLSLFLQQVGRGLRSHEDIDKVIFLDNVGSYNQFGLPSFSHDWNKYFYGLNVFRDTIKSMIPNGSQFYFLNESIEQGQEEVELLYETVMQDYDEIIEFPIFLADYNGINSVFFPLIFNYEDIKAQLEDKCELFDIDFHDLPEDCFDDSNIRLIKDFKKVRKGLKFGIINELNDIIIPLEYDEIENANGYGFSLCFKNGKRGLLNVREGKTILPPEYDKIESTFYVRKFSNYIIGKDEKEGLIDDGGKILLQIIYKELICEENFYNALYEDKWLILNEDFEEVNTFDSYSKFDNNSDYFKIEFKNRFGLWDINSGQIAYPITFNSLDFSNNHYIGSFKTLDFFSSKYFLLMDEDFEIVIPLKYTKLSFFDKKILLVKGSEKTNEDTYISGFGLIDINGKTLISTKYNSIEKYQNFLLVNKDKNWMVIDWNEKILSSAPKKREAINLFEKQYTEGKGKPISSGDKEKKRKPKLTKCHYPENIIIGMRIEHEKFGYGVVVNKSICGEFECMHVKFDINDEIKKLVIGKTLMRIV